uniref:HECT domain-containing protein n=1 Tax=Euplotes harpa TaxID=151035 RepID=A0A7S3NE73_9SPIT|mmetsp:Transcript_42160/g.48937  ORF Transcript_42160/g.48937 Transcript_42160/m.48937 type:complete len:487 (+) Transcript_42160:1411-2871(+)
MPSKDVQPRVNAYLSFNQNFLKVIPYVILDEEMIKEVTEGKAEVQADTLSILFMISKSLAFKSTKYSYIKKIADSLPTNYDEPDIQLNRRLIMHKKDRGKVDHKGEWTTFGCVFKTIKDKNFESLRKANSSYKAWRATFVGEGSIDAGGPYRESLTNITDELQSACLPLLIKTQNHKNDHGLNRDCWTINPSSTSPSHLEMYKFLGALIGMAFRAGHVIDLKFPPIFWKKFIGDPITLDDLNGSDAYAVQAIKDLEKNKDSIPADMFEDAMNLTFTTQLSDGSTVPICEGGANRKVSYDDVAEYHRLVLKTRSEEGSRQMAKMREGFEIIFPMSILGILNWRDIEERVRGPSEISVTVLKSITEYSSCSADNEFVERFWRVFEEFTNDERSMFLKFVWGRARLPPSERIRDQNFKIYLMDSYKFTDHNIHFPEAHTCFFQLDLPRYTTDEACKSKILYAITACGEIDTDGSSYSYQGDGGNYDDSD